MSYLTNILSGLLSADMGVSEDGITKALNTIRLNEDAREREGLRSELISLYKNTQTDWIALLENNQYEVYPATSNEDGKGFVTRRIWNVLFPEEQGGPSKTV